MSKIDSKCLLILISSSNRIDFDSTIYFNMKAKKISF